MSARDGVATSNGVGGNDRRGNERHTTRGTLPAVLVQKRLPWNSGRLEENEKEKKKRKTHLLAYFCQDRWKPFWPDLRAGREGVMEGGGQQERNKASHKLARTPRARWESHTFDRKVILVRRCVIASEVCGAPEVQTTSTIHTTQINNKDTIKKSKTSDKKNNSSC